MPDFHCPVCGGPLRREERALRCARGHSYDRARQGYVNLLMSNHSSAKRHGDDKAMVAARRAFLDKGYYAPLRRELCEAAVAHCGAAVELLDAGCGEGWYTAGVQAALTEAGKPCRACGIDISREALIWAAKRGGELALAVAGVNRLPVANRSCDLLLSIFAPMDAGEFRRVLRRGGILLRAVPLEEHLMGLKAAVYDRPYPNPPPDCAPPEGFRLLERRDVRDTLQLSCGEDIRQLFMMTPYYYKTGRQDQEKLLALEHLETAIAFGVLVYQRL